MNDLIECGFYDSAFTTTSTTKSSTGKKYRYKGKTTDHAPKDLSVSSLDEFVLHTVKFLLKEPELLEAVKQRATREMGLKWRLQSEKLNSCQTVGSGTE